MSEEKKPLTQRQVELQVMAGIDRWLQRVDTATAKRILEYMLESYIHEFGFGVQEKKPQGW